MTLTDFLLARIAEDEAAAKVYDGEWTDRVLAQCAALRRIVELHQKDPDGGEFWGPDESIDDDGSACTRCGYPAEYAAPWPCDTLRALATIYADHPDFDPAWELT